MQKPGHLLQSPKDLIRGFFFPNTNLQYPILGDSSGADQSSGASGYFSHLVYHIFITEWQRMRQDSSDFCLASATFYLCELGWTIPLFSHRYYQHFGFEIGVLCFLFAFQIGKLCRNLEKKTLKCRITYVIWIVSIWHKIALLSNNAKEKGLHIVVKM